MKRIITATVQNHSGVLNRITGMLQRRQFNISSSYVEETEVAGSSKMAHVVEVNDHQKAEKLTKQLNKQIEVIKVSDITDKSIVTRELALVKVSSIPQTSKEIQGL